MMNKGASAKLAGMSWEQDFAGGMPQYFDWGQALTSKHKSVADGRFGDGSFTTQADLFSASGLEAPRNSVDYSVAETPRTSHVKQDDIPVYSITTNKLNFPGSSLVEHDDIPVASFIPGNAPAQPDFFSGLEAPRNSVDYSVAETPRTSFARRDDVPFGFEISKSGSGVKKEGMVEYEVRRSKGGRKEMEAERKKSPSVVARLMGLEALPDAKKGGRKGGVPVEVTKATTPAAKPNVALSKKPQEIKLLFPKQSVSLEVHVDEVEDEFWDRDRDHPQEKQLQEFKKHLEAKLGERSRVNQLEGSDKEFEDKKVLVRERLNEAKKTLGREKLSEGKRVAARQKLKESKEFLEALELLQSNKEFFLRFLQEPLSSLAKHMQEVDVPCPDVVVSRRTKQGKSRSSSYDGGEGLSPRSPAKQVEEVRRNREAKLLFQKQQGPKTAAEMAMFASMKVSSDGELSHHGRRCGSPRAHQPDNNLTRIVLLKPTLGKGSPHRSASSPACSPRPYRTSGTGERRDSSAAAASTRQQSAYRDADNVYYEDPRDIAREIVRQAQESVNKRGVARPLPPPLPGSGNPSVTRYGSTGKRVSVARSGADAGGGDSGDMSSDGDGYVRPYRLKPFRESQVRSASSSPRLKSLEHRDVKKRPEKIKVLFPEQLMEEPQLKSMYPLGRNNGNAGGSTVTSSSSNSLEKPQSPTKNPRQLSKKILEGLLENQHLRPSDAPVVAEANKSGKVLKADKQVKVVDNNLLFPPKTPTDHVSQGTARLSTRRAAAAAAAPSSTEWSQATDAKSRKVSASAPQSPQLGGRKLLTDSSPILRGQAGKASSTISSRSRGNRLPDLPDFFQLADTDDVVSVKPSPAHHHEEEHGVVQGGKQESSLDKDAASVSSSSDGCQVRTSETSSTAPAETANQSSVQVQLRDRCSNSAVDMSPADEMKESQGGQVTWSLAAEGLDNVDGASEVSVEKGGQPSPVSILDSPFEQESPQSPTADFKEVASDLQELRVRLQLLKLDGIERPTDELGDEEQATTCIPELLHSSTGVLVAEQSVVEAPMSPSAQLLSLDEDSYDLSKLCCPNGREDDLVYVRDLLVFSGFVGSRAAAMSRWLSSSRPLDASIFDKLEDLYCGGSNTPLLKERSGGGRKQKNGLPQEQQQRIDAMNRRVLFEVVNEVLLKKLGPLVSDVPWSNSARLMALCTPPSEKQLVQETWSEICTCHMPIEGPNYTLENMVERDLRKGRQWEVFHSEAEEVRIELEAHILSELMEDAIRDLLQAVH